MRRSLLPHELKFLRGAEKSDSTRECLNRAADSVFVWVYSFAQVTVMPPWPGKPSAPPVRDSFTVSNAHRREGSRKGSASVQMPFASTL